MSGVISFLNHVMSRPLWAPLGYYGSILEPPVLLPEPSRPEQRDLYAEPYAHAG